MNGRKLVVLLVLLGFAFIFNAQTADANAAELFISEYIEGSSNNKAVEIYNGTGAAVDLAAGEYQIEIYSNGNTTAGTTIGLTGVVADGDVYVVADNDANAAILAETDQTSTSSFYNGDDAVVLRNSAGIVDVIGQIGFDPGSEWGTGDTSTQNNTIVRNADVCAGDTDGSDLFDPAAEWTGSPQDTTADLGSHTANCDTVTPPGQPFPFTDGFDNDDCTVAGWQVVSVDADQANTWSCSAQFSNADVNGFGDTAPADEWLITPALDMEAQADETLEFRSYTDFTDINYPQLEVVYSSDYDGSDPSTATWTALTGITLSPEDSAQWTDSGTIDLSGISGSSVHFAFHYTSSGTGGGAAATWRLDSVDFNVDDGGGGPTGDALFISEYIEGSSNNKAVEIYNSTGAAVDLAAGGYQIEIYSNGNTSAGTTIALTGTVADGDVYVVADNDSVQAILDETDQTSNSSFYNGDDAVVLRNSAGIVDVIGQVGFDPGSEWGSGDTSTQNNTIVRNPGVCAGDTDETDIFDPAVEWTGFPQDTFSGLGAHTATCDGSTPGHAFPFIDGFDNDDCTIAGWQVVSVDADQANTWGCSAQFSNADVNGFGDSAPADEWLITPALNMEAQADETLDFRSWTRFTDVNYPQLEVVYSSDYDGSDPSTATWTQLSGITFSPEDSQLWTDSGTIDLSGISGTSVYFAFHYVSSGTGGGTTTNWRLDQVEFDVASTGGPVEAKVHEVQGSGATVALDGQEVTVEAIVIGDYQADDQLRGFFIQEEDADADTFTDTSEGIFVFCGGCDTDVAVGDLVEVTGIAEDFFDMSQIDVPAATAGAVTVVSSGNTLPTPATVSFPASGSTVDAATFENVEGMLITSSNDLFVSEYFQLARYGQLVLTADARPRQFTDQFAPDVAGYAAFLDTLASTRIILDDDNNIQNAPTNSTPDTPYYWPRPGLTNLNLVRGGDSISGLTGVMHWSFAGQSGTDAWRIRPVDEAFSYNFVSNNPRQAAPDAVGGTFKVASFNVLNYFTTLGSRGADSAAELDRQREKISAAICAIDADVVGLIEIENNGQTALNDLLNGTNGVNAQCGTYASVDAGVIGTDEIAVAYIYKTATAAPVGLPAVLDSSVDPTFIDTKNRPALAQTFEETATGGALTIAVNHFKSKGSSCDDVGDPGLNDGAANCNLTRATAATALANWLATDPTGSGDDDFMIIGDLNAYRQEDPITNLVNAGYVDLLDASLGGAAYSFVFDGQLGYLDYALANGTLNGQVTGVTSWHISADEINVFDYNDDVQDAGEASFERESDALPIYEANAFRASDHDPIIVGLNLDSPQPTGFIYASTTNAANLSGMAVRDEDISVYDLSTGTWAQHFDGSDVGLGGDPKKDVDAFAILPDGSILLSIFADVHVPGLGWVDDSDIIRFVPSAVGSNTAGSFERYFDGSDVGLTTSGEDIDGIDVLPDGRILISTRGNVKVGLGTLRDEDVLAFTPTKLGKHTQGSWELYADGSDIGLGDAGAENIDGLTVIDDSLYFTTRGSFDAGGVMGNGADTAVCTLAVTGSTTACSEIAIFADDAALGLAGEKVDGLQIVLD